MKLYRILPVIVIRSKGPEGESCGEMESAQGRSTSTAWPIPLDWPREGQSDLLAGFQHVSVRRFGPLT